MSPTCVPPFLCLFTLLFANAALAQAPIVRLPVTVEGRVGFVDGSGALVISPQFDAGLRFTEGLGAVRQGSLWGYIDTGGELVHKPTFQGAMAFSEGRAAVKSGGRWGFIDASGKPVVAAKYEELEPYSEDRAWGLAGGKWHCIDKAGAEVFAVKGARNLRPGAFREGLAGVPVGDRFQVVDPSGKVQIAGPFALDPTFREGYGRVLRSGKFIYIDRTGKQAFPEVFERVTEFSGGFAGVMRGREVGVLARDGKFTPIPGAGSVGVFSGGLAAAFKDRLVGYVDTTGRWVIRPQMTSSDPFVDGIARFERRPGPAVGDHGWIDAQGRTLWSTAIIEAQDIEPVWEAIETAWEGARGKVAHRAKATPFGAAALAAFLGGDVPGAFGAMLALETALGDGASSAEAKLGRGLLVRATRVVGLDGTMNLDVSVLRPGPVPAGLGEWGVDWSMESAGGKTVIGGRLTTTNVINTARSPLANAPDGDYAVRFRFIVGGTEVAHRWLPVTVLAKGRDRLAALRNWKAGTGAATPFAEGTVSVAWRTLEDLVGPTRAPWSRFRLHALITTAEAVMASSGTGAPVITLGPGDHWVGIRDKLGLIPARLYLPASGPSSGGAHAVVIALHGTGMNEHYFFDHVGGTLVAEAEKRGWYVLAPRNEILPGKQTDHIARAIAAAKTLPGADTSRIYLVGHSAGGAEALLGGADLAPDVAGVAAFAPAPAADRMPPASTPVYLAVGKDDLAFVRTSTDESHKMAAKNRRAYLRRTYDATEHLFIAREAMAEACEFLGKGGR